MLDNDKQSALSSNCDTFDKLSEASIYSTPRKKVENELHAFDRVMPFDFITQRKAKKFFKEDLKDVDQLLKNQLYSKKQEGIDWI